jgi:hypothetical protein
MASEAAHSRFLAVDGDSRFAHVDEESGDPVIRYCFEREADAEAFHALFAAAADKAVYKKGGLRTCLQ